MTSSIETIVPLFQHHQKFVLTTHVNPDGDGLGSEVALAEFLLARQKQVEIINHSPTPYFYQFLDPNRRIKQFDWAKDATVIASADVIVVMDTNHLQRIRSMEQSVLESNATRVCIDHHLDPAPFAKHYVLDDDATSTGEIVYKLLQRLGGNEFTPLIAQALYCAIMTDTGSFRYPRVDPETHRIVAHLLECGADPVEIYRRVYDQWTPGRIKLLGETLETLSLHHNGRLASIAVTQTMLQTTGTAEVDTDNFTTYPMSVAGVEAGILFLELRDGLKISFRSKGEIPINELAKEFGGNGHKNAAGARLHNVRLQELQETVIAAAGKYLQ